MRDDDERPLRTRLINVHRPRRASGAPSSDIRELWNDGIPLSDAWYIFAENEVLDQLREPSGREGWDVRTRLMQADLLDDLRDGALRAIGIRESSDPYEAPEIIPADLFEASMTGADTIFGSPGRLTLAGRSWVKVRVTEREWKPPKSSLVQLEGDGPEPNKKMGRPTQSDNIEQILREMVADQWDLAATNQKRICAEVIDRAQTKGLQTARGFSEPVIKTILRRVRNEMLGSAG